MSQVGFFPELFSAAGSIFGGGGGQPIEVTTDVNPQISPIFQQQFQPTNSAMSAGVTGPGAVPAPMPGGAMTMPAQDATAELKKWLPWILLGGIVIYAVKQARKN